MAVAGAPAELIAKIAKNLVLNPLTNAVRLYVCECQSVVVMFMYYNDRSQLSVRLRNLTPT